jgi:prevent-host-death family protein
MTPKTTHARNPALDPVSDSVSTADAKRRFSELVDRVEEGERFIVSRRGRPAVALVPPTPDLLEPPGEAPAGLATLAGALADWTDLDDVVADVYAARRGSADRPAPDLD